MSRRKSKRSVRQGGPYFRPSRRLLLPLTHESVRRLRPLPVPELAEPFPRSRLPLSRPRVFYSPSLARSAVRARHQYAFLRSLPLLPRRTRICIRRKVRREVLFALDLHGRHGAGGSYNRTQDSQYSCKR